MNTGGNMVALKDYMHEQDMDDAKQQLIDDRAAELVEIHTADIDDMIIELIEENQEKSAELLKSMLLKGRAPAVILQRYWFYKIWIPERCKLMAEKELGDE